MKAHTKLMREELSQGGGDLFGRWWEGVNFKARDGEIREIDKTTASKVIMPYEWLSSMPAIVTYAYGIYFDTPQGEVCGGAVVFGTEYAENLGVWDKYGYTGRLILLSRGACVHWAPRNTNSRLVSGAIKRLPKKYRVVTATVDPTAGETGTIYQACNFHYVGVMRESKTRLAVRIKGKIIGSRNIRSKLGTQKEEEIKKAFPNAEIFEQPSKARYFYFRGDKKERESLMMPIKEIIEPYPKSVDDIK